MLREGIELKREVLVIRRPARSRISGLSSSFALLVRSHYVDSFLTPMNTTEKHPHRFAQTFLSARDVRWSDETPSTDPVTRQSDCPPFPTHEHDGANQTEHAEHNDGRFRNLTG